MSTSELVYPYEVADDLELRLTDFSDAESGEPLTNILTQGEDEIGRQRYDLVEAKPAWTDLQVDVSFTLASDTLERLLPDPASVATETVAVLSVRCASTKYRRGVRLRLGHGNQWRATVQLCRADISGIVELTPSLVRATDLPMEDHGRFAGFAGAVLATGKPVQLVVDRFAKRFDGSIEYVWEHFGSSANAWRASRKDDVFHLEPGDTPKLYLNLRWGFLKPLLEFEGRTGAGAAMRDLTAAAVAQGAWTQLLTTAMGSIRCDGDEWSVGGEAWRTDLVTVLLAELYPDVPAAERLRYAQEEWRDPATVGSVLTRIGATAQTRATLGKLMERATRAMESVANLGTE